MILPIMIQLLKLLTAPVQLLTVEMMAHTGLKPITKIRSLRLENFTRKTEIMIAGVMIIGVVIMEVSEPLILL